MHDKKWQLNGTYGIKSKRSLETLEMCDHIELSLEEQQKLLNMLDLNEQASQESDESFDQYVSKSPLPSHYNLGSTVKDEEYNMDYNFLSKRLHNKSKSIDSRRTVSEEHFESQL